MGYFTEEKKEEWTERHHRIKLTLYKLHKSEITPRELSEIVNADLVDVLDLSERKGKSFYDMWTVAVQMDDDFDNHPFDVFVDAIQNNFDPPTCKCCGQVLKTK